MLEIAGLAPVPFAGMVLADFGAHVIRIDNPSKPNLDVLSRGKLSISMNLKHPQALSTLLKLIVKADVLIDPFRPGLLVMFC